MASQTRVTVEKKKTSRIRRWTDSRDVSVFLLHVLIPLPGLAHLIYPE